MSIRSIGLITAKLVHLTDERVRALAFLSFFALTAVLFWPTVQALVRLSLLDDRYSYIVLIPLISACIIYWKRNVVFRSMEYCWKWSVPAIFGGLLIYPLSTQWALYPDRSINLTVAVFAIIITWIAGFLLVFGFGSFRSAMFPLFFLLFMIPLPAYILASAVSGLQQASAVVSAILFRLLGVPNVRHGLLFSLPGVDIEIAEQCSGIRSSASLFISGVLASYLLLQSAWKRLLFSLFTIVVAIFKNAVRIVSLSWLGVYVNPDFLHGRLHHYGGLPVSLLALAILAPVIFALRRTESRFKVMARAKLPLVTAR